MEIDFFEHMTTITSTDLDKKIKESQEIEPDKNDFFGRMMIPKVAEVINEEVTSKQATGDGLFSFLIGGSTAADAVTIQEDEPDEEKQEKIDESDQGLNEFGLPKSLKKRNYD